VSPRELCCTSHAALPRLSRAPRPPCRHTPSTRSTLSDPYLLQSLLCHHLSLPSAQASPVGDLLDVAQRQKTASELNAAILASQAQEREPRLPLLLKLLLWAQAQLDERAVYPRVVDLATAQLVQPPRTE
jgi:hypothetical protein